MQAGEHGAKPWRSTNFLQKRTKQRDISVPVSVGMSLRHIRPIPLAYVKRRCLGEASLPNHGKVENQESFISSRIVVQLTLPRPAFNGADAPRIPRPATISRVVSRVKIAHCL